MNSSSSGKRLESFLSGKGFYIVLFLCAAVIGVSAWMVAAGNETMREDMIQTGAGFSDEPQVETVIIPARPDNEPVLQPAQANEEPAAAAEPAEVSVPAGNMDSLPAAADAPVYSWPVSGELSRAHSGERLVYDPTMQDWRVHEGIDILAAPGTEVRAACAGTVESVRRDDMLGTVVTLRHADGSRSFYANLEDSPAVSEGQWVEAGQSLGAVGSSALCEVGQEPHLHFAMQVGGSPVDPMNYLVK